MQIVFTVNQPVTASALNQATQGYKFLRRTTYAGSSGSPTGHGLTTNVTWNIGSGTSALYVIVQGAGGGSSAARGGNTSPTVTSGVGAPGGGGGGTEAWILSGISSSQTITIGLGGNAGTIAAGPGDGGQSKFGNLLSAGGGLRGVIISWDTQGTSMIPGGDGGVGSGGLNRSGNAGSTSVVYAVNNPIAGRGGMSAFGGAGGIEGVSTSSGANGLLYGGGAGGACVLATSSIVIMDGGRGAPGFVIVDEYA